MILTLTVKITTSALKSTIACTFYLVKHGNLCVENVEEVLKIIVMSGVYVFVASLSAY